MTTHVTDPHYTISLPTIPSFDSTAFTPARYHLRKFYFYTHSSCIHTLNSTCSTPCPCCKFTMTAYYSYHQPFGALAWQFITFIFGTTAMVARYQYDYRGQALWFLFLTSSNLTLLLDPALCALRATMKLPDGSEVRVNKPLIAFKICEKQTTVFPGALGEGLPKEWHFDKAYLRI